MSYENPGESLSLHAEDLWSKFGFRDGDIFTTLDQLEERRQELNAF